MNTADVLKYGQLTVLGTIDGMPEAAWNTPGVCGAWSAQDVIAHLTSFERLLVEVLRGFVDGGPTPYLDQYTAPDGNFNDDQVARRRGRSIADVLDELNSAHAEVMALVSRIPDGTIRRPGTLPWYGAEYALDDMLVYMYYGHKREHCAQIALFRDRLHEGGAMD